MLDNLTDRQKFMLAAMSTAERRSFQPVQVQKLFFLLEKRLGDAITKFFDFQPYDYGPFDHVVYHELERLQKLGLVGGQENSPRQFSLTDVGQELGEKSLADYDAPTRERIATLTMYVLSLSFRQLVSAIYREYPEMRANSVFRN